MNKLFFFRYSDKKTGFFCGMMIYYTEIQDGDIAHMDQKFAQALDRIIENDRRYHPSAYEFINEAVSYTVKKMNRSGKPRGSRHVSGQELITGTLEYAREQFGPLAPNVLDNWGIRSGGDIGNIVYNMIREELLSASPEDSRTDFECYPDLPGFLREEMEKESADIPELTPPFIA